jgi:hypothetical protein
MFVSANELALVIFDFFILVLHPSFICFNSEWNVDSLLMSGKPASCAARPFVPGSGMRRKLGES